MVADYQILTCTDEHHVIPVKNIFYNDKRNGGVKEKIQMQCFGISYSITLNNGKSLNKSQHMDVLSNNI